MVAQSGGPTVAINASLAGVIDGVMRSDMYDTVYGSLNGITGILNNDLTNLSELMQQNSEYLDRLKVTPAMYLGSCRYKLPNYLDDDSSYVFIFKQFETYHIDAFFYIGRQRFYGHRLKALRIWTKNRQSGAYCRYSKDHRQ